MAVTFHEHHEPARGTQQSPLPADVSAGAELLQATRRSRSAEHVSLASLAEIDEVAAMANADGCLYATRRCVMEVEVVNHSGVALQARAHASACRRLACQPQATHGSGAGMAGSPHAAGAWLAGMAGCAFQPKALGGTEEWCGLALCTLQECK